MKKILTQAFIALYIPALLAQDITFSREEYTSCLEIGNRQRVTKEPFLYSEVQYKYGLFQNFLGMYIDRPLYFDRSTRYPEGSFAYMTAESYFRDIEIMKAYGFDGSGSLALGIFNLYKMVNRFLDENPKRAKGHQEFPQFAFGGMDTQENVARKLDEAREILKIALKSPYTPKVNGRIPITSYYSAYVKRETMETFLATLREEFGDSFQVMGSLLLDRADTKQLEWNEATVAKYQARIQGVLDLFDGIQVPVSYDYHDKDYMTKPAFDIYKRYLLPLVVEQLNRPEYRNKLAGAVVTHGYINHMSGVNHGEFGTRRLRESLDNLMLLNPDFIVFFEWNEFNENTCFQPTLYNSLALQRLIRFYSHTLKGKNPEPNPGDDLQIPPLIVSTRETLKVGEVLEIELLNVPDTLTAGEYKVTFSLRDQSGKTITEFPSETFDCSKLRAITYSVPTETLSEHTVLLPSVDVTTCDGEKKTFSQIQYIRLLPTFCYNYKAVRQPLRDLLQPQSTHFKVSIDTNGLYVLSGEIDAGERLTALEVTDYGREFYAVDRNNEFDREKNIVVRGTITTRKGGSSALKLRVSEAPGWKFRPWGVPNVSFGRWKQVGDTMTSQTFLWGARIQMLLTIPRSQLAGKVQFTIGDEVKQFEVSTLLELGKIAQIYPQCRVDWEILNTLADIPNIIGKKQAQFSVTLPSDRTYPIFQMRAVTESGKIYRSAPIIPKQIPPERTELNIVSETSGDVIAVNVPKALIPTLKYQLNPARGAMLANRFDPYFDAQLGGGFVYAEPFRGTSIALPGERYDPEFITETKQTVLKFSGDSSYINFPLETFPRGSFTLKFDVRPDVSAQPYVLFRHFGIILGSITVYVKDGELYLAYGDRSLKTHQFASGLFIQPESWSTVVISYNYRQFTFKVNDEVRSYPVEKPLQALYFKSAIFGGHTKPGFGLAPGAVFYRGLMRNLEIHHNAVVFDK